MARNNWRGETRGSLSGAWSSEPIGLRGRRNKLALEQARRSGPLKTPSVRYLCFDSASISRICERTPSGIP